jgi:hypothetical protein
MSTGHLIAEAIRPLGWESSVHAGLLLLWRRGELTASLVLTVGADVVRLRTYDPARSLTSGDFLDARFLREGEDRVAAQVAACVEMMSEVGA